jgi:hypothetical protein
LIALFAFIAFVAFIALFAFVAFVALVGLVWFMRLIISHSHSHCHSYNFVTFIALRAVEGRLHILYEIGYLALNFVGLITDVIFTKIT